jgi:hypothetical protein
MANLKVISTSPESDFFLGQLAGYGQDYAGASYESRRIC